MAISLRNSAKNNNSTTATPTVTLSASVGDIILVKVGQEKGAAPLATVTGINDGTSNVYKLRFASTGITEPTFSTVDGLEVWWAYCANALVAATITASLSATIDDAVTIGEAWQGFTGTAYQTNPFDPNSSLPAFASSATGTNSFPTVSGVSTTSAAGVLIDAVGTIETGNIPSPPSGWTNIQQGINNGAVRSWSTTADQLAYSSAQSSITVTTTGLQQRSWIYYVDALTIPTGGGGGGIVTGWQNESSDVYRASPQKLSAAPAFISTFKTAGISGSAWNAQRDHVKLPPRVVFSDAPPYGHPAFASASTISGIAWDTLHENDVISKGKFLTDPVSIRFNQVTQTWSFTGSDTTLLRHSPQDYPPGYGHAAFASPVPISGIAWDAPRETDIVLKGRFLTDPVRGAVPVANPSVVISGMAWFEPPDRDRPATRISVESLPAAFVSTFKTAPISGIAWFTTLDWSKAKVSYDQPSAFTPRPLAGTPISGMAWFEPPDRDKVATKVRIEAPPSIALTPATLPVKIGGMAWFEPPDRDRPATKIKLDYPPAFVRFPVGTLTLTLSSTESPDLASFAASFRVRWLAATIQGEAWTQSSRQSETWTPATKQNETWSAATEQDETWTPATPITKTWTEE